MTCDFCGKNEANSNTVTRSYGNGNNLFIIENIPMITCSQCGESYFTSETLYEIERIKLHRNEFSTNRLVPVADYV